MLKTSLEEWNIDRKEPVKDFLTYTIFESDNGDYAFYFYQIEEWSIYKYCSKLKIYSNKIAPRIIFDSKSVWFLYYLENDDKSLLDWSQEKLISLRQLKKAGQNQYLFPFIILNLSNFTYAEIVDDSLQTLKKNYDSVIGIGGEFDKIVNSEKVFELARLRWMSTNKLL